MSKPDPPTPPNPIATAAAQTGTNVSTGVANAFLNNVNQNTPNWIAELRRHRQLRLDRSVDRADLQHTQVYRDADAVAAGQQRSRAQRPDQDQSGADGPAAVAARSRACCPRRWTSAARHRPATPRTSSASARPRPRSIRAGNSQTSFGDAGDITRSYGPQDNFSADRQRVEDSLMARMNPQLDRERGNIEQRLADQGIRYGSQAYASAMDDYNRQANDARFGAVSQAGQEQQRMTQEMAAKRRLPEPGAAAGLRAAARPRHLRQRRPGPAIRAERRAGTLRQRRAGAAAGAAAERISTPQNAQRNHTCRSNTPSATSRSTRSPA